MVATRLAPRTACDRVAKTEFWSFGNGVIPEAPFKTLFSLQADSDLLRLFLKGTSQTMYRRSKSLRSFVRLRFRNRGRNRSDFRDKRLLAFNAALRWPRERWNQIASDSMRFRAAISEPKKHLHSAGTPGNLVESWVTTG